jgi:hypothetical protein
MKSLAIVTLLLALWCGVSADAQETKDHCLEFGLGFPQGDMDVSANGFLSLAEPVGSYWQIRGTLHETFSMAKKDSYWLGMNVIAGYALARFGCNQPWQGFAPFVEVGGGLHFITSYASGDSPVNKSIKVLLLAKAHGFLGAEYSFGDNKFLSLKARFTYPSDLIFDAAYLNYGIRF